MRMEATGLRATSDDSLSVCVSRDAGLHWQPVWHAEGTGPQTMRIALRDEVAGVTQCLIKIEMRAAQSTSNVGLDSFRVVTITQLDRLTLPKLTVGTNEVLLRADEQVETTELWPVLHAGAYRQTATEEDHVFSDKQPDGMYKATLGAGVDGRSVPSRGGWRSRRTSPPLPTASSAPIAPRNRGSPSAAPGMARASSNSI